MDIILERVLSLIPKKPNGEFVHGEKKKFCKTIGAPTNIVSQWEIGKTKSYRNYLYVIADKYDVSVEWLKGETDEKQKKPLSNTKELSAREQKLLEIFHSLTKEQQDLILSLGKNN